MMKAPILSTNQFAVLMADGATGHVLTTTGDVCYNDEGNVYLIFDTIELARAFILREQNENDTLEFVIYNSNNECIEHWEARKWKC
jgi:hypothetical protein